MSDFSLDDDLLALRDRVRELIREVVIPAEPRDVSAWALDHYDGPTETHLWAIARRTLKARGAGAARSGAA